MKRYKCRDFVVVLREKKMTRKWLIESVRIASISDAGYDFEVGYSKPLRRLLPFILRKQLVWDENFDFGSPVLFEVIQGIKTFDFLKKNKVDFYQKDSFGNNLLHEMISFDAEDEVFLLVLDFYKSHWHIDDSDDDGFSALSCAIKFGKIGKASALLDVGADTMSRSKNGLTPWKQAIICLDGEDKSIACLELLASKSKPSKDYLSELIQCAGELNHERTITWMEKNLV
jgi:hypothetical protein